MSLSDEALDPGHSCIVVKKEIPDESDHVEICLKELKIEWEERSIPNHSLTEEMCNVPVKNEKQEPLQVFEPAAMCDESNQIDSVRNEGTKNFDFFQFSTSVEEHYKLEVVQGTTSVQNELIDPINCKVCVMGIEQKEECKSNLCDSSYNLWHCRFDGRSSKCENNLGLMKLQGTTSNLTHCSQRTSTRNEEKIKTGDLSFSNYADVSTRKISHLGDKQCNFNIHKSLSSSSSLKKHKIMHMSEKPFTCNMCYKSFTQSSDLIIHKRAHTGEKPFTCNICSKSFYQSSDLIIHKKAHTGERPFSCTICKRSFSSGSTLLNHRRIHTGEKPFNCNMCNKSFSQSSDLIIHKRAHAVKKLFTCNVCNKSFSGSSGFIQHKRLHTGEKPFTCNMCNKSFSQSSHLIMHKRAHTGEKPFTCNICKKSFSSSSTLTKHIRVHTGEKPFTCNICNNVFSQSRYLIIHKRVHTGENYSLATFVTKVSLESVA